MKSSPCTLRKKEDKRANQKTTLQMITKKNPRGWRVYPHLLGQQKKKARVQRSSQARTRTHAEYYRGSLSIITGRRRSLSLVRAASNALSIDRLYFRENGNIKGLPGGASENEGKGRAWEKFLYGITFEVQWRKFVCGCQGNNNILVEINVEIPR